MPPVTIVENEFITLQYLPDKKTIYHVVHKPIADTLFKEALDKGTVALAANKACKWLSDDRLNGPLTREQQDWAFNDWNPRTIKVGWKYWALVVPQAVVDAGTLMPVIESLFGMGLRVAVFSSLREATDWLDSMPE